MNNFREFMYPELSHCRNIYTEPYNRNILQLALFKLDSDVALQQPYASIYIRRTNACKRIEALKI